MVDWQTELQSAFKKKRCFSSIASCLTTGMRFQTNGFKASRLVSQLACVFKPMVLRPLVASHNWHARLRLWKNQWLMWCFAVSLLNRFLKPMVLRPLVASHNWHARLSLIDTMAFLTTNGFKASDPSAQSHWYYGLSYNQWFYGIRSVRPVSLILWPLQSKGFANALQIHSKSMPTAWQLHGKCIASDEKIAWLQHCKSKANALQMHGNYMNLNRSRHTLVQWECVATAQQMHGNCMAIALQMHCKC